MPNVFGERVHCIIVFTEFLNIVWLLPDWISKIIKSLLNLNPKISQVFDRSRSLISLIVSAFAFWLIFIIITIRTCIIHTITL